MAVVQSTISDSTACPRVSETAVHHIQPGRWPGATGTPQPTYVFCSNIRAPIPATIMLTKASFNVRALRSMSSFSTVIRDRLSTLLTRRGKGAERRLGLLIVKQDRVCAGFQGLHHQPLDRKAGHHERQRHLYAICPVKVTLLFEKACRLFLRHRLNSQNFRNPNSKFFRSCAEYPG